MTIQARLIKFLRRRITLNRERFLELLEYELCALPIEEKEEALTFYRNYLEEAGEEAENEIAKLGSPKQVAQNIQNEFHYKKEEASYESPETPKQPYMTEEPHKNSSNNTSPKSTFSNIWEEIGAILVMPFAYLALFVWWVVVFSVAFSLYITAMGFLITSIVLFVGMVYCLLNSFWVGVILLGVMLIFIGLTILMFVLANLLVRNSAGATKGIQNLTKKVFLNEEKGGHYEEN